MGQKEERDATTHQGVVSDDKFSEMFSTVVDVTILVDESGTIQTIVDTNPAGLGYSSSQLSGEPITTLFTNDVSSSQFDVQRRDEFEIVVLDAEADGLIAPIQTANGNSRSVKLWTVPRPDPDGPICFGRVLDEFPSTTQTTTTDDLLDSVADPLYVLDSEGDFEQVNDALVDYTGYDCDKIIGRSIAELLPASAYERATARLLKLVEDEDNETTTFEMPVITNDGEQILTEANVTALTDEAGNYAGSVGVLRDIRERKHREQNLDLLKQVLARVFRHNVRNELTIVKGHAELLEREVDDDQQAHASEILETADRLLDHSEKARLIENVVEFEDHRDINLGEIVHSSVDTIRDEYPEATIETDLPGEAVVQAHPDIGSAIKELLDNAVRHAPTEEDAHVEVWLDQRENIQTLFVEDESGGLVDHEIDVLEKGGENDLEHSSGVGLWLIRWLVEYSNAEMIVHRTDSGSLMGIRFTDQTPAEELPADVVGSSLEDAPAHVRDVSPEQFRGDTVIGRIEPLNQLEERYEALEESGGHSVFVKGEAGIGKTTLVEQFRDNIETEDDTPLIATGFCESETQPAYHAFRQAMTDLPFDREISEILSDAVSLSAEDPEEFQQRKRALFAGIATELREVAGDQPVVLVVEDMQWADQGTIDLFEYLVAEVGRWGNPVLFVGTYRTSNVEESNPVLEIADETAEAGRGTVLELESFGKDEIESLLSHMLAVETLPKQFTEAIADHTGGTPLFVHELGRHLVDTLGPVQTGTDLPESLDEVAVPETVERALTERLESLPDEVWPVLRLGAVIGRAFSFDLLREASEEPTGKLIEDSNTLVRRELWEQSADGITFAHGLVREQTLEQLGDQQRESLHATVAEAIETVYDDELDEHAGRLGHHYAQIGEYETAFNFYQQAGDHAAETYANEDAISQYERALSLAREQDVGDDAAVAEVYTELGDITKKLGEYDQSRKHHEQALKAKQETGDRNGAADSLIALGDVALSRGEYGRSRDLYEQSLTIKQEIDDQEGEAEALNSLGSIAFRQSEYDRARDLFERSLAIRREIDSHAGEANSLSNLGIIAMHRGEFDRSRELLEESLEIERNSGNRQGEAIALTNLGKNAIYRGEDETAREYYTRSLEIFREIGDRSSEGTGLINLGVTAEKRGNLDCAQEYYEESLEILEEIGERQSSSTALFNLGEIVRKKGEYNRAREYYSRSAEIFQHIGNRRGEAECCVLLGITARQRGRDNRAREYYEQAQEIGTEIGQKRITARALLNRGVVAATEEAFDSAAEDIEEALTIADEIGIRRLQIKGNRELGALERRQGAYDRAAQILKEGQSMSDAEDDPWNHAKLLLEQARLDLARDELAEASETIEQACGNFADLGATHEYAKTLHLKGKIAAVSGSPAQARKHWLDALDTFEDIGAPQDTLKTLTHLVETCKQQGDLEKADEYETNAEEIYESAPEPVQEYHGAWLDC